MRQNGSLGRVKTAAALLHSAGTTPEVAVVLPDLPIIAQQAFSL